MAVPKALEDSYEKTIAMFKESEPTEEVNTNETAHENEVEEVENEDEQTPEAEADPVTETTQIDPELAKKAHQYDVLKGKYDREVPELARQVRELKEQLSASKREAQQAAMQKTLGAEDYGLTEDELEYGDNVISMARKIATKEVERVRQDFQAELERIRETEIQPTRRHIAEADAARFERDLTQAIPDIWALNDDPKFVTWLRTTRDKYGRKTLGELFESAYSEMDLEPMIAIVGEFKGLAKPKAQPKPNTISQQVVPPQAAGVGQPAAKVYRMADYMDIVDKARRKQISESEFLKLKAEYQKAIDEGRVVGD